MKSNSSIKGFQRGRRKMEREQRSSTGNAFARGWGPQSPSRVPVGLSLLCLKDGLAPTGPCMTGQPLFRFRSCPPPVLRKRASNCAQGSSLRLQHVWIQPGQPAPWILHNNAFQKESRQKRQCYFYATWILIIILSYAWEFLEKFIWSVRFTLSTLRRTGISVHFSNITL